MRGKVVEELLQVDEGVVGGEHLKFRQLGYESNGLGLGVEGDLFFSLKLSFKIHLELQIRKSRAR